MFAAFESYVNKAEDRLAREDDANKDAGDFNWGEPYVTSCSNALGPDFVNCLSDLRREPGRFYALEPGPVEIEIDGAQGGFSSPAPIGNPVLDRASFSWFPARSKNSAVVIIPHWNGEPNGYRVFARIIAGFGSSTAILTLPYHGARRLPGTRLANDFLSANIGKTVAAVRQGVLDCATLCSWMSKQGYGRVVVVGISLGSCIAGLAAAHTAAINKVALLLSAGDFGSVVLSGRATRHIHDTMYGKVDFDLVRKAWAIISTNSYVDQLARQGTPVMMLSGLRDPVILPELTRAFEENLRRADASVQSSWMPCGHHTLSMFPFNVLAVLKVLRFIHT